MSPISRHDVRDGAKGISVGTALLIVGTVIALLVISLLWAFGVFTAGIKGSGDVHRDQQNAKNREHWSATFNAEYQQVQADQDNLAVLKNAADGDGATQQDRTNYTGAQLNCRTDVAAYNADAASVLGSPWIPAGLPTQIDAATYCEG